MASPRGRHRCTKNVHRVSPCLNLSYCDGGGSGHNPTLDRLPYRKLPDRVNISGLSFSTHLLSKAPQPVKQVVRHLWCARSYGEDGRMRSSLCLQIPQTPSEEEVSLHKGSSLRTQVFGMSCRRAEVEQPWPCGWPVKAWDGAQNPKSPEVP